MFFFARAQPNPLFGGTQDPIGGVDSSGRGRTINLSQLDAFGASERSVASPGQPLLFNKHVKSLPGSRSIKRWVRHRSSHPPAQPMTQPAQPMTQPATTPRQPLQFMQDDRQGGASRFYWTRERPRAAGCRDPFGQSSERAAAHVLLSWERTSDLAWSGLFANARVTFGSAGGTHNCTCVQVLLFCFETIHPKSNAKT